MASTIQLEYPVSEIFESIQGEGLHMGKWVTFIRLAGCNLRCPWCDTADKAFDVHEDQFMTIEEINKKVRTANVVITGGEPSIYKLGPLVKRLKETGVIFVAIETNGTNKIPDEWGIDWVTCSPKPPLYEVNCHVNELKYVVDETITINDMSLLCENIWLQPESCKKESVKKALSMVEKYSSLRMGIQLHKVLEVV